MAAGVLPTFAAWSAAVAHAERQPLLAVHERNQVTRRDLYRAQGHGLRAQLWLKVEVFLSIARVLLPRRVSADRRCHRVQLFARVRDHVAPHAAVDRMPRIHVDSHHATPGRSAMAPMESGLSRRGS